MSAFNSVFTPIKINNSEIKNRVFVPAMALYGYADETGCVTNTHIKHYTSLASGGVGLIVQEATSVTPDGRFSKDQLGIWDDSQIEGLKKIADGVHQHDGKIIVQLNHAGINAVYEPKVSASDFSYDKNGQKLVAREITKIEIATIQKAFVEAAVRAELAGYDGIELHACHRYLGCQFLNRRVNKRTDKYSEEAFLIEIIRGIREKVAADFMVGIRIGGFEPTLEDGIRHAIKLSQEEIDFLDVSYGFFGYDEPYAPEGFTFEPAVYAATMIKKNVTTSVWAVNGITEPEEVEDLVKTHHVDMVGIGRSSLIDAEWVNHVKSEKSHGKCLKCKSCLWESVELREHCPGVKVYRRKGEQNEN